MEDVRVWPIVDLTTKMETAEKWFRKHWLYLCESECVSKETDFKITAGYNYTHI